MIALILASCSNGGDRDRVIAAPFAPPPFVMRRIPPPVPANPALYSRIFTAEYFGNYGLDSVHAGNAYIAGLTGAGVTVAVIDSGVADIAKLQGQIAEHINVTASPLVQDDHGTSIASVIVAKSDGVYMHGIAYGARIADIKTGSEVSFSQTDLETALAVAAGKNRSFGTVDASIVNLSLGGTAPISSDLRTNLEAVVNAGKIIVIAAGNNSGPAVAGANPSALALFATDPDAKGQVIIAGASTQAGTLARFSDRAGSGKAFYLVAPGDQIATLDSKGAPTTASGTSYSAPIISGAAALLEQEFPNLTAAKVVQILLTTADPLATGTAADYGVGLLNLAKAIQPIGALSIPMGKSASDSAFLLSNTRLTLGQAFGSASRTALAGLHVLALDSFQRGYMVALPTAGAALRDKTTDESEWTNQTSVVSLAAAQLRVAEGPGGMRPVGFALISGNAAKPQGMDVAFSLNADTVAEFGQHLSALNLATASLPDMLGADETGEPLFLRGNLTVLPQASFADDGYGAALTHRFGGFRITAAAMSGEKDVGYAGLPYRNGATGLMQLTGTTTIAGIDLGLGLGRLTEDGRTFGAVSGGALSLGNGGVSTFVTVTAVGHLTDRLELNAAFTEGRTRAGSKAGSLFANVDGIASNAFAIGAIQHDALVKGDMLGFQVAQPIRVSDARADLSLPMAMDADGNIVRGIQHVNLAPRGREIDLQIAYRAPLEPFAGRQDGGTIQAFVMARFDPGHNASAATDYAAGIRYNIVF